MARPAKASAGSHVVRAAETTTPNTSQPQMNRTTSTPWATIARQPGRSASGAQVASGALEPGATRSVSHPLAIPVTTAAATLSTAKGQPKKLALTKMESTPVWGVAVTNPTADPRDAPSLCSPMPAGITPHEQSGMGTPSNTAFTTPRRPDSCRRTKPGGSKPWSSPDTTAPSNSQGDSSVITSQAASKNAMCSPQRVAS